MFFDNTLWSKIGKNRQNSHPIIHCPTSEGVSKVSERCERANGRASGPVLQSVFLAVFDHSALMVPHLLRIERSLGETKCRGETEARKVYWIRHSEVGI